MTDLFGSLKDIVSIVADSKAIVGAGGLALLSVAGAIPRFGFVRAVTLGCRSYFKTTYPLSVRKSDIKQLHDSILVTERGHYIVVIGGKGNGKSCMIDTALNRQLGLVEIDVRCLSSSVIYIAVK